MNNCLVLLMISLLSIIVLLVSDSYGSSLEDSFEVSNEDSLEGLNKDSDIKWIDVGSDTLYSIESSHATWQEANEKCKIRGKNGRLATIDSEDTLISLRRSAKGVRGSFWIGIRQGPAGTYQRIGGVQSDYFNWGPGEPNNPLQEKCVQLLMISLEFNNAPCSNEVSYICVSDKENKTTTMNTTSASSLNGTDSTDWIDIGTRTLYSIEFTLATWNEAFEKCKLKGKNGRLASIDSILVSYRLEPYIVKTEVALWIGIRKDPSGSFARKGTEQSRFFNWDRFQPNNWLMTGEDCVELYYFNMKWNDVRCNSRRFYLCASDKDLRLTTISSIPRNTTSVSETTLATSVNSTAGPLITRKDSYEPSLEDSFEVSNEYSLEGLNKDSDIKWIDVGSDTLYSIESSHATWQEADEKCKMRGKNGRLATIDSEDSLINLRRSARGVSGSFWIGIRQDPSGAYQRIGGVQSDYFNWAPGEPNQPFSEKCVELIMMSLEFNNAPCSKEISYICVSDKENKTTSMSSTSASSLNGTDSTDWIDIGTNTLYSIEFSLATWNEAFENCKLKGKNGRLASINSILVSNRLEPYIRKTEVALWIGIRKGPSGAFARKGSAQSRFFNWDKFQPNNWQMIGEDCVELFYFNMKWNDVRCNSRRFYLCASDKDSNFSTITSISRTTSSVLETTLATSVNSMAAPLITHKESGMPSVNYWSEPMLADIAKESHAALTAICFLIVFVFLVFVVALVLKRWPLNPQVQPFDTAYYCKFS